MEKKLPALVPFVVAVSFSSVCAAVVKSLLVLIVVVSVALEPEVDCKLPGAFDLCISLSVVAGDPPRCTEFVLEEGCPSLETGGSVTSDGEFEC